MKKQISIRIEENLLKGLDMLMSGSDIDSTLTYKIESLIRMNMKNYNAALKSLVGKFSYLEACYMAQAFNGTILQLDMLDTAKYLFMTINDFYIFGSMGFYSDEEIDVESLLEKLENLTDYQALVVINSISEFWKDCNSKEIANLLIVSK